MDPDQTLIDEIESWRSLHKMHKGAKVPSTVSAQSKKTLAFLEELLELRRRIRVLVGKLEKEKGVAV